MNSAAAISIETVGPINTAVDGINPGMSESTHYFLRALTPGPGHGR
jgi:hypothetical protein